MSTTKTLTLLLASVAFCFSLSHIAFAGDTVDPCQYGCPKDGCSNCPTGGPIEKPKAKVDLSNVWRK